MFYIGYKDDGVTACIKQARGMEYICEAKNGAQVYAKANEAGDFREWYYTVGGVDGMLARFRYNGSCTPDELRGTLFCVSAEQTAQALPDRAATLARIEAAVNSGEWTSNGDALLCELCGKPDLAAKVRANREAYKARQAKEEQRRAAEEEQRRKTEAEAEQKRKTEELEQAERDLRAGLLISPAYFEQLAEKYGVSLPIKFVGWLRKWCGRIRLKVDTEYGGYTTQYFCNKNHKSTSIGTYGNALGKAMAI